METKYYNSKIGWWVYAIIPIYFLCSMTGPILSHSDYLIAVILTIPFCAFLFTLIFTTKYAIRGNELGVRSFYRWSWFPIDNIESIRQTKSILTSAALSTDRIAIKFKDRKILKSAAPLEISPKHRAEFISELLSVNPTIKVNI